MDLGRETWWVFVCVSLKRVESVDVYVREAKLGSECRLQFCVEVGQDRSMTFCRLWLELLGENRITKPIKEFVSVLFEPSVEKAVNF